MCSRDVKRPHVLNTAHDPESPAYGSFAFSCTRRGPFSKCLAVNVSAFVVVQVRAVALQQGCAEILTGLITADDPEIRAASIFALGSLIEVCTRCQIMTRVI